MSGTDENTLYDNFGGRRVNWEYVSGQGLGGVATSGHGVVAITPRVGNNLFIVGDDGITTSPIKELKEEGDTLLVTTQNSVYKLTLVKVRPYAK
jgi:hypothetical protein